MVSCFVFTVQLLAAFIPGTTGVGPAAVHIVIAAFAGLYVALGVWTLKSKYSPSKLQLVVSRTFWFFFSLSMLPFYLMPRFASVQTAVALACAVMIAAQIYSVRQILFHFVFHTAVGVCAAAFSNAGAPVYAAVLLINLVCLILALSVHKNYSRIVTELYHDAQTDDLTGLLNRGAGMQRVRTLWKHCGRMRGACAALMIDIDFFKSYNDAFGHLRGDAVLVNVARVLRTSFSRATDVVCRLGGEEFLVCAVVKDEKEALSLARTVLKRVEGLRIRTAPNGVSEFVTVSVGVSVRVPEKDKTERMLVEDADINLYVAKSGGRNRAAINHEPAR